MSRSILDIIKEGGGIRISWSDNSTDQYIWNKVGDTLALRDSKSGEEISRGAINEILDSLQFGFNSGSLWSHAFGVAGGHLTSSAITQIGDNLSINTWTRVIYNESQIESESSGLTVDNATGIITLAGGEWSINAIVNIHKTSANAVNLMIQLWNETESQEFPHTFRIRSTATKHNAPASIRMSTIVDSSESPKSVSVRVRSDASDVVFGVIAGDIPAGSENSAGTLVIERLG